MVIDEREWALRQSPLCEAMSYELIVVRTWLITTEK
jgi:hypothetical protein